MRNVLDSIESSASCTSKNGNVRPASGCSSDTYCTSKQSGYGTRYLCNAVYSYHDDSYYGENWGSADNSQYTHRYSSRCESANNPEDSIGCNPYCDVYSEEMCAEDQY